MRTLVLATLLSTAAAAAEPPGSTLEVSASVPAEFDGCLDHSVKELGMSAKRVEKERRWKIGPQFLHPSIVPEGTVTVTMEPAQTSTAVRVQARWPGGLKPAAQQTELQERAVAMVTKMAQVCGVTRPKVSCSSTSPGRPAAPCSALPGGAAP
jgi:hypothetical protein